MNRIGLRGPFTLERSQTVGERALQFPATPGNERGVAGGHIEFLCRLNQCLAAVRQTISGSHGRLQGHLPLPVQTIDLGYGSASARRPATFIPRTISCSAAGVPVTTTN